MFRTSNPAFRNEAFQPAQTWDQFEPAAPAPAPAAAPAARVPGAMTMQGVVNKTGFLLTLCTGAAVATWSTMQDGRLTPLTMGLMLGGVLGGLITALICCFAPKSSPVTAPLYALFEGAFLGGISAVYATKFGAKEGDALNSALVINAILLTFGIAGGVLAGYATKLIRPGPVFRNCVIAATFGVCLYAFIAIIASFFGGTSLISVYDPTNGGLISIGFSAFVVVLASANLVLDFDIVSQGVQNRAPKYMEWYSGFGILVTLVWLYVEVLRLLSKLQSRD